MIIIIYMLDVIHYHIIDISDQLCKFVFRLYLID